jgi:hypothetical protein
METLYVAAIDTDLNVTRVEQHDREGLRWMRRVPRCIDTHAVIMAGDRLAVCSTGTNEIILLDLDGVELKRWSPDPSAEQDSWHVNSLAYHDGRLLGTCFRRHPRFRGLSETTRETGLLLDLETGRPVLAGLSMPHDPCRIDGGWVVNDSANCRTLLFPDSGGKPTVVAELPDFSRGLAILAEVYVIGFSIHRSARDSSGCAGVSVVDRSTLKVVKSIRIPFREIGHVVPAPAPDVLAAIVPDNDTARSCLVPRNEIVPEADRSGSLAPLIPFTPSQSDPDIFEFHLVVTNRGNTVWSSFKNDSPVCISYDILDDHGNVVWQESGAPSAPLWPSKVLRYPLMLDMTARSPLPLPILPGKSLTVHMAIDLFMCQYLLKPAAVRFTLIQEGVASWNKTELWQPAVIELPMLVRGRAEANHLRLVGKDCAKELSCLAEAQQLMLEKERALHQAKLALMLEKERALHQVKQAELKMHAELFAAQQSVQETRNHILELQGRLAPYENIGPFSIRLAHMLRRLSLRYPGISKFLKYVIRQVV